MRRPVPLEISLTGWLPPRIKSSTCPVPVPSRGCAVGHGPSVVESQRGPSSVDVRVWGLVPHWEMSRVVTHLLHSDDPRVWAPEYPWAVVLRREDGRVVATCSGTWVSGLFWSVEREAGSTDRRVIIGVDAASVVAARRSTTHLDADFVADFLTVGPNASDTPYREVRRIGYGTTAIWAPGAAEPTYRFWSGPEVWGEPDLDGSDAIAAYLQVFDEVIDECAARTDALVATCSAGLDSTFVVASLARHAGPDRVVVGLHHRPIQDGLPELPPGQVADEFGLAREMESRYPGRVALRGVVSEGDPLQLSIDSSLKCGCPTFGVFNRRWSADFEQLAHREGAAFLFNGGMGNASFSWGHEYWLGESLRRDPWRTARWLARNGGDSPADRLRFLRAEGRRSRWAARNSRASPLSEALTPLRTSPPDGPIRSRADFLAWLGGRRRGYQGGVSFTGPVLPVDPFASTKVRDTAARITPRTWRHGGLTRSFARMAGAGRVPDSIRLRRERGLQSADAWTATRRAKETFLRETGLLAQTPLLGETHLPQVIGQMVGNWRWDDPVGPRGGEVNVVARALALGGFLRGTGLDA